LERFGHQQASADERSSLCIKIKGRFFCRRSKIRFGSSHKSRNRAAEEIGSMQMEVKKIIKSRTEAEAQRDAALGEKESSEKALVVGRKDNTEAVQKAKRQVDEKQRELKAINTALADTPDNILKKLKTLRKQKIDEANARTKAEDANRKLKKENKQQKEELETLSELKEQAASLLAAYRELRTWSDEMEAKTEDCDAAPKVDSKLLSDIETTTAGADETEDKKEAATA
jgi:colicin import membrane protein